MRRGQGLPVNMIVLTALALLVLVVVGAFFISGFGQASGSVNIIEASQADCQALCQGLAASAFNYECCKATDTGCTAQTAFLNTPNAQKYWNTGGENLDCDGQYGACTVTLRNGNSCAIEGTAP
ncbi:MAG TPA: hypothetical protein VI790_04300 [Candidatus Nanoarchaeia archaeon]|nr:hypothetical protein [Candidatus Nanoarchaeia archaeon]